MKSLRTLALAAALVFGIACSEHVDPIGVKTNPSLSEDIVPMTNRKGCTVSGCHGSGAGGMTLGDAQTTYDAWVNVPSTGAPGEIRVIPFDAQNSYVVKKVEGRMGIVGSRMPLTGTPLDEADLTNLRRWIDQGAQNN